MLTKEANDNRFMLSEGISSKILECNKSLMLVENKFEKGVEAKTHSHENEQAAYIISGKFELIIEGERQILKAGDSFIVEKWAPHSCLALEKGSILDIFTPYREDILKMSTENK